MRARTIGLTVLALAAAVGAVAYTHGVRSPGEAVALARNVPSVGGIIDRIESLWTPKAASAQSAEKRQIRVVPVEVSAAVRKPTPVIVEALGTVTPVASVVIKPRIDSVITAVNFADGATVKQGDILFTLDSRSVEAQIRQAEGMVARDKAQLEGALRDVRRFTDLVAKSATPVTNLDNAKTQADTFRAQMQADQASLDNLKVMLSYCTIRAPISGRISAANLKIGNYVRAGSDTVQLATINQIAPIYVSFAIPQARLSEVRDALSTGTAAVEVSIPGSDKKTRGKVTMIDNTVDPTTGMVTLRATMPNKEMLLWPGTLVTADLSLRVEDAITVPSVAVQVSQSGNFAFVIQDGIAHVRPVKVERSYQGEAVIAKGLSPGELVVTDGQLLLGNGTKVTIRNRKAGA